MDVDTINTKSGLWWEQSIKKLNCALHSDEEYKVFDRRQRETQIWRVARLLQQIDRGERNNERTTKKKRKQNQ